MQMTVHCTALHVVEAAMALLSARSTYTKAVQLTAKIPTQCRGSCQLPKLTQQQHSLLTTARATQASKQDEWSSGHQQQLQHVTAVNPAMLLFSSSSSSHCQAGSNGGSSQEQQQHSSMHCNTVTHTARSGAGPEHHVGVHVMQSQVMFTSACHSPRFSDCLDNRA